MLFQNSWILGPCKQARCFLTPLIKGILEFQLVFSVYTQSKMRVNIKEILTIIMSAIAMTIQFMLSDRDDPVPQHTSILSGSLYYQETMDNPNVHNFRHITRMDKETFLRLLQLLQTQGLLKDSRKVSAGEKVFITIYIFTGQSFRAAADRFQHSTSTIHEVIYETMNSMKRCKGVFMTQFEDGDILHHRIGNDPRFFPFFEHAIGALDGTHVPAVVPAEEQDVFRNRKGWLSQNVLGVCDFDMLYTYCLSGWEGSAHDGKVLINAWVKGLRCPVGKYFLADAGYPLTWRTLTPYRGVRYHLKEWAKGGVDRPQNYKELFNLRHASLRNVVERIYGVTQKRFPITTHMNSFPILAQADIVACVFMLHNFIRRSSLFVEDEFYHNLPEEEDDYDEPDPEEDERSDLDIRALHAWRDDIAIRMWDSYQVELARRA